MRVKIFLRDIFGVRSCNQAIASLQDLTPLTLDEFVSHKRSVGEQSARRVDRVHLNHALGQIDPYTHRAFSDPD